MPKVTFLRFAHPVQMRVIHSARMEGGDLVVVEIGMMKAWAV